MAESVGDKPRAIYRAINKYGKENFVSYRIDVAYTQEELDEKESYWISHYNTFLSHGYNMTPGGQFDKINHQNEDICNAFSKTLGGKEFYVFDVNGNLLKTTTSQTLFSEEIGCSVKSVNACLKGKKTQVKKCILIYKDKFTEEILNERIERARRFSKNKPDILVFDVHTGEQIGVWNCIKTCGEDLGISTRGIQNHLKKDIKNPKKYIFKYASLKDM